VPLVPVTVTVKVPLTEAVQDKVEVPEPPVIEVGVRVQVRPVLGDTAAARLTVPVNPLIGVMVMVEVRATPVLPLTLVGLALIVKSVTVSVTVAV